MSNRYLSPAVLLGVWISGALSSAHAAEAADDSATTLETIIVTAERLDAARTGLSPDTGSSIYRLSRDDLQMLPLGDATPLNQIMLQTPGVVQDSLGQLHVRGDHSNVQYRINGVVIPEAISGFGQALDSRFADHLSLLTGALPAQYGYRTAAVVDIQTKGYSPEKSASLNLDGGSRAQREAGLEAVGSSGQFSYSLIGSHLQNDLGIENPVATADALHDSTEQNKGFGYLSYILPTHGRLSLMFGLANNHFQIPDRPGLAPNYALAGYPSYDSAQLDARQQERNDFETLSYQSAPGDRFNGQWSLFRRRTEVLYHPDPVGDLIFNGIAADIRRADLEYGLQADVSLKMASTHTLRGGVFFNDERFTVGNTAQVFAADNAGTQLSDVPFTIVDDHALRGHTGGVYLQDEWQPTHRLTVNYGARFDQVRTVVDEQQFSPRLGLVYELSAVTRWHVGYARYFTPPPTEKIDTTSVAKFLNTTNALPSTADTSVASERSHYFDLGVSRELSRATSIGVDAYYRHIKNLQDEGQFGNALIYSAFNFAAGRIYGAELTASYHAQGLSAYANLAYSVAKGRDVITGQFNFDAEELAYIASHWVHLDHDQTLAASAGFSYTWRGTQLSADSLYGSGLRRGFANTQSLPAYVQLNLSASRDFSAPWLGKLNGRLSLNNALDRTYQIRDGTGIGVGAPQFAARRALIASLRKDI